MDAKHGAEQCYNVALPQICLKLGYSKHIYIIYWQRKDGAESEKCFITLPQICLRLGYSLHTYHYRPQGTPTNVK